MVLEVKDNVDDVFVGLRRNIDDKLPGVIFLVFFFGMIGVNLYFFVDNSVFLIINFVLFSIIMVYHIRYNYDGKIHLKLPQRKLEFSNHEITIEPDDKVVLVNESDLIYYLDVKVVSLPETGPLSILEDVKGELEPVTFQNTRIVRINVTNHPELIEVFTRPQTYVLGFNVNRENRIAQIRRAKQKYYVNLQIQKANGENIIIMGEDAGGSDIWKHSPYFRTKLDELRMVGEIVAEKFGITLIDNIGIEERVREVGSTDLYIGEFLRLNEDVPELQEHPDIEISRTNLEMKISTPVTMTGKIILAVLVIFFLLAGLGIFSLLFEIWIMGSPMNMVNNIIVTVVLGFIAGAFLLIAWRLFFRMSDFVIKIDPDTTHTSQTIGPITRKLSTIPTKQIEGISIFRRLINILITHDIQIITDDRIHTLHFNVGSLKKAKIIRNNLYHFYSKV